MSTYKASCMICEHKQTVDAYDGWTCKKCGQGYEYEEGTVLCCRRNSLLCCGPNMWAGNLAVEPFNKPNRQNHY